jgi:uncharacterized membrane protein
MYILGVALGVIAFFMVMGLRSRVSRLEELLYKRSEQASSTPSVGAPAQVVATPAAFASVSAQPQVAVQTGPTPGDRFTAWLKEDWLLKLGALLLLIGFGWLTSYAFINNWIGPMGRITLGIVAGAAILVIGWWRIRRFLNQGSVFLALGSTVILLTVFAARIVYNFFTPWSALGIMALSIALVALISVRYRSRGLAVVSLILAAIAPQLTNLPSGYSLIALFSYLLVIVIGSVWIVALTGWLEVPFAALLAVAAYSVPRLSWLNITELAPLLPFAYIFAGIFFAAGMSRIIKIRKDQKESFTADLMMAMGNGALLILWIVQAAPEVWQSLILSAWMVVFVAASFVIFRITGRREPFYAYASVGVAMIGAATAAELSGASLAIAFIIEAAILVVAVLAITRDRSVAERTSLLFLVPIFHSVPSALESWRGIAFGADFSILLLLGVAMLWIGLFFSVLCKRSGLARSPMSKVMIVAGSLYLYATVWKCLQVIFHDRNDIAVGASLTIYTIVGLVTYFMGMESGKGLRYYGGALLVFVVGRLLLIDVWQMALSGRIVTFFLIGTLLMTTAFVGRRFAIRKSPEQI